MVEEELCSFLVIFNRISLGGDVGDSDGDGESGGDNDDDDVGDNVGEKERGSSIFQVVHHHQIMHYYTKPCNTIQYRVLTYKW